VTNDLAPKTAAATADNGALIVADSYRHQLVAFDIAGDGSLSGRRTWADLGDAAPDGICVGAENAVWFAEVPGKRCVRVAEGGAPLQTAPGPRRLRLRPRRPGAQDPVHHGRRMAWHDRAPSWD
jgi:sugar lactone lactonase YvrE